MSNQKECEARLKGYRGPFFPESLAKMHNILYGEEISHLNGAILDDVSKEADLGYKIERNRTSDTYMWFWLLVLQLERDSIVIALPWAQDRDRSNETRSDRHSALYIKGAPSDNEIDKFIDQFTQAMLDWHNTNVVSVT